MRKGEWFRELCYSCKQEKLVHVNPMSSWENPVFICSGCEKKNLRAIKKLEKEFFKEEIKEAKNESRDR